MDSRQKASIASLVDELATNSVLLDLDSTQDIAALQTSLKQLLLVAQEYQALPLSQAVELLLSVLDAESSVGKDKIQKILACWIGVIQEFLIDEKKHTSEVLTLAQYLDHQFQQILSVQPAFPFLEQAQSGAFREAIENGLGIVSDIEKMLLCLEKDPASAECIHAVFRLIHTLKGEAGLVGLKNIFQMSHCVEGALEKIRGGFSGINAELIALLLSVNDATGNVLQLCLTSPQEALAYDFGALESKVSEFCPESAGPAAESTFMPNPPVLDLSDGPQMLLEFVTESTDHLDAVEEALMNFEGAQDKAELVNKIFRGFHTIKGVASFLSLEDIRILAHETETMMDYVRSGRLAMDHEVTETAFKALDVLRKLLPLLKEQILNNGVLKSPYLNIGGILEVIRRITGRVSGPKISGGPPKKIGDILIEKNIIDEEELLSALDLQSGVVPEKKIGEILVEIGAATRGQIERGLKDQKAAPVSVETIKISVRKLDDLVDTMGELVITGTQVIHHPEIAQCKDDRLHKDISQLDRIIRDIQNISMAVRLVPIRPVFQKMTRLVRDLAVKSGKKIDVQVTGEDTEIDKNITELISDPLIHMVRNSVDHGIEPADLRLSCGKPKEGLITLNAYHKGGNIIVEVFDDGAGLDRGKILKKAIERGLVSDGEALSDERIYQFIFEAGFSTAEAVTDISGRGVGMDVVKRNIEQLQGRIDIESKPREGTKFSIRLPLTLAIIEGIVVAAADERYILPIFVIEEFMQPHTEDVSSVTGQGELIRIHDQVYPLVRLDRYFGVAYKGSRVEDLTGCLVNSDYGRICLLFDALIGQQQVVIKNLGGYLKDVKGLSGATILGDGRVGLILDVNGIAALCKV